MKINFFSSQEGHRIMKIPFTLGLYFSCEMVRHLIQEQQKDCKVFEDRSSFDAAWHAKDLTTRLYLSKNVMILETWASLISFTLPLFYEHLFQAISPLIKGSYYRFQRHGLHGQILRDPQGQSIFLRKKEQELLTYLMEHHQASKEELLKNVWHYDPTLSTRTVETHLFQLRQKIQSSSCAPFDIVYHEGQYGLA